MFALNGTLNSFALRLFDLKTCLCRLLEHAANYFDLSTFTDGETKRALQRVVNKRSGKREMQRVVNNKSGKREKRRRKKN